MFFTPAASPASPLSTSVAPTACLPSFSTCLIFAPQRLLRARGGTGGDPGLFNRRRASGVSLPFAQLPLCGILFVAAFQVRLVKLADGRARQLSLEVNHLRHLVPRELLATVRAQHVLGERCVRLYDDGAVDGFDPTRVRYSEDSGLEHVRMGVDDLLDFFGVDVVAAGLHHVLAPVHDVEETVLVELADVAGQEPGVAKRLLGLLGPIEVADGDLWPPQRYLAGPRAVGHLALLAQNRELDEASRSTA